MLELTVDCELCRAGARLPEYMTGGAAGMDVFAPGPFSLERGGWVKMPTGLKFRIPRGWEGQIRPRSSPALNLGLDVLNGTIDSDFRGEINIIIRNSSYHQIIDIHIGQRVAQIVFAQVARARLMDPAAPIGIEVGNDRSGGFGSTGA